MSKRKFYFFIFLFVFFLGNSGVAKDTYFEEGKKLFAILIFIYVLILELAPSPSESNFALMFNVVAQKAIVLVFIFSVFFQNYELKLNLYS